MPGPPCGEGDTRATVAARIACERLIRQSHTAEANKESPAPLLSSGPPASGPSTADLKLKVRNSRPSAPTGVRPRRGGAEARSERNPSDRGTAVPPPTGGEKAEPPDAGQKEPRERQKRGT